MDTYEDFSIPLAKVFTPTLEEFQDFDKYVNTRDNDPEIASMGMYKV